MTIDYTTCPTCGALVQSNSAIAHVCDQERVIGMIVIDEDPIPLTDEMVRRIVREELAKSNNRGRR